MFMRILIGMCFYRVWFDKRRRLGGDEIEVFTIVNVYEDIDRNVF